MAKNRKTLPQPDVQQDAEEQQTIGYITGEWAGRTQYRCRSCAFDCLDLDQMLDHLVDRHSPVAPSIAAHAPGELEEQAHADLQPDEAAQGIYEIDLKEDQ